MAFEIIGTGRALPSRRVDNDELSTMMDTSDEWIRSHTGIGARYIAAEEVAASDLALEAAQKALAQAAGISGDLKESEAERALKEAALSLDMIILATATPDYYGTPSTACIVQDKIGAKHAGAMDIGAGCTGFIYALETGAAFLALGADRKRVLVIGTDVLSKIADWSDRSSCVLFGDGSGAVVLEKTPAPTEGKGRRGLIRTVLGADGSGADYLRVERGGSRYPFKDREQLEKAPFLKMDGQVVYNFAVKAITDTVKDILAKEGISSDQVARIIPHQANARIIQAAAKRLRIPEEKFYINIEEYANTSSASIPIALDELHRNGELHKGDLILTVGFGSGLTYGANLLVW